MYIKREKNIELEHHIHYEESQKISLIKKKK